MTTTTPGELSSIRMQDVSMLSVRGCEVVRILGRISGADGYSKSS